jgi:RNA polymerase sigma-54 factor
MSGNKNLGLNLEIKQKLRQELRLTPILIQTMKLMELSTLELQEKLEEEYEINPFLKINTEGKKQEEKIDRSDDNLPNINIDYYEDTMMSSEFTRSEEPENTPYENILTYSETLEEHLTKQIREQFDNINEEKIAFFMVGNLDEKGFQQLSPFDLKLEFKKDHKDITLAEIERIRKKIMLLKPIGCSAYNVKETVLIQIEMEKGKKDIAYKIVDKYWSLLLRLKYEEIAKEIDLTVEEVQKFILGLKKYEIYPGRQFSDIDNRSIIPDVILFLDEKNEIVIILNDLGFSKYTLNSGYYEKVNNEKFFSRKEIGRMKSKYENALFLIKGIYQRRRSLYLVTKAIFEVQKRFLTEGVKGLKPLTLKEIAEKVDMHESTISRITRNKFVQTLNGIFRLKFFFSSKLSGKNDDDVSSKVVKENIKKLIADEVKGFPLSDQALSDMILEKYNIKVARRTTAKYREALGIPRASIRKRII